MIGRVGADRRVRIDRILAQSSAVTISRSPVHALQAGITLGRGRAGTIAKRGGRSPYPSEPRSVGRIIYHSAKVHLGISAARAIMSPPERPRG